MRLTFLHGLKRKFCWYLFGVGRPLPNWSKPQNSDFYKFLHYWWINIYVSRTQSGVQTPRTSTTNSLIPSIFTPWCHFPLILSAFCRAFQLTTNHFLHHCQATDKAPHRRSCCDCQSWGGCTATHASDVCLRNWWCGWARPGQVGESLEVVNPVNPQEMEVSLKYGYP